MDAENKYYSTYADLAKAVGASIPTLRAAVNRPDNPLPCVRLTPRKLIFVRQQVEDWFKAEAERQSSGM